MKLTPLEFEKPLVELEKKIEALKVQFEEHITDAGPEIEALEAKLAEEREKLYSNLTPWQRVQIVRHPARPYTLDYLKLLADDYMEMSGDRCFGNDRALLGGLASIGGERVMIIGHQKGHDTKQNIRHNFGLAHPEGYRKALRLMRVADKFGLPIVSFIDTPGAYPGIASEERHIAEAIAVNLREMFTFSVPIVAVVLGEGGSGGALGIGVADRVLILENAYYSVISPEGCAAILWKDQSHAPKAADALKMTAPDLLKLKLVDEVIPEPAGGAHHAWETAASAVKDAMLRHIGELKKLDEFELKEKRYAKFRAFGEVAEAVA
ncbi:MAG TPA: acetyl-CoA carboxylase carboxyltransferase subunit alpha [Candidatus Methylacidiphilales bacterium]|jgi:acetyl-CoA carboxylase carboxyl transferase subunit alpha|nr:acetyl-CoA carboxylase carboxyltransferase subunit alpha [Candidatus Methylacidiphilales bacterium]